VRENDRTRNNSWTTCEGSAFTQAISQAKSSSFTFVQTGPFLSTYSGTRGTRNIGSSHLVLQDKKRDRSAGESQNKKAETERRTVNYWVPNSWAFTKQYPDGATEHRYALLHRDSPGSGTRPKSARRLQPEAVQYCQCERKRRESFSEMNARIPERNHILSTYLTPRLIQVLEKAAFAFEPLWSSEQSEDESIMTRRFQKRTSL
jgi:hypothetical protein